MKYLILLFLSCSCVAQTNGPVFTGFDTNPADTFPPPLSTSEMWLSWTNSNSPSIDHWNIYWSPLNTTSWKLVDNTKQLCWMYYVSNYPYGRWAVSCVNTNQIESIKQTKVIYGRR